MQIGISTIWKIFQKEGDTLGSIVDYYETILTGNSSELSSYAGSEEYIKVAHLTDMDKACFDSLEVAGRLGVEKAVIHFHTVSPREYDAKIETLNRLSQSASEAGIRYFFGDIQKNA
jgi:hypothetical protein